MVLHKSKAPTKVLQLQLRKKILGSQTTSFQSDVHMQVSETDDKKYPIEWTGKNGYVANYISRRYPGHIFKFYQGGSMCGYECADCRKQKCYKTIAIFGNPGSKDAYFIADPDHFDHVCRTNIGTPS